MRNRTVGATNRWRPFALACIAALGLVTIVGSGGGGGGNCGILFSNTCDFSGLVIGEISTAQVFPQRATVQVGGTATFTVETTGFDKPTYRWRRSSDGGSSYVDIPGATGASFTLAGAQLVDDSTLFRVDVQSASGANSAFGFGQLAVSSMPGVVLQDGEFVPGDWLASAVANPAQGGPSHSETRATTGGNPGAFRSMVYTMTPGPSSLSVFHTFQPASYDPASQGAIHVIDFSADCLRASTSTSGAAVESGLLIEQGGRRYASAFTPFCAWAAWGTLPGNASLRTTDFVLVDGPACGTGESCPDFSATAVPLRFGLTGRVNLSVGSPAGAVVLGIDNWRTTVWRK